LNPAAGTPDFPRVSAVVADYVDTGRVAGVSLAIKARAADPRFINVGRPAFDAAGAVDEDTIFRIYSMSKPVTGLAAMLLLEDGKLALDQPISTVLPAFADMRVMIDGDPKRTRPAAGPIRVRHLLTHTAGLSYAINPQGALPTLYREWGLTPLGGGGRLADGAAPSLEAFGERLANLPLSADPGQRMDYSVALDLLGLILQRVEAMPFPQVLRERLFDPLGMSDTDFHVPTDKLGRLATNYRLADGRLEVVDAPADSAYAKAPGLPSGGAGLVSTARDYTRLCAMLLNDGVLDGVRVMAPETVRLACSNLAPPGVFTMLGDGFGAGQRVVIPESLRDGDLPVGAVSWGGAAGTTQWVDRASGFALVMMTQFMPQDAYPIWEEIRRAAYADLTD
jgi:CubicO group peptidase (beta-lactamase class C family)